MDKYSRLLVHFSTVNGNKKDEELYPSFVKDVSVLESPNEELTKIIKDDLPTLLPAILILSVHEDVSIRTAIARTFDTFCLILNKNPSVKNESWWKDMEAKLIAQQFSSRLVKMVELNDEPWADDWAFVTNLIVHDEHVHGTAINSLLKVVETAFKMSKKNDAIMEKAYFCWNQLIDVFSKHPRVVCSQKLVELLVRPLSTTHLSLKCPDLKMQTWCHLMRKIGFSCGNKCKFVMEPFIEFMYLKGEDSLCINYSKNCMDAYAEMIEQKKIYKHYALKVMSAFPACSNSCTQEMEQQLVKIWTGILENIGNVDKNDRNTYLLEIFTKFHQTSQSERQELNSKLMKILVEKDIFNIDNLRSCIMSELTIASVFSDFMKFEDFRNICFPAAVKDLMDNFSEGNKKPQNNIDLQIWDILCEIYSGWMKNQNDSQDPTSIDSETWSSLLMIPFTYKQWSVAVQKTWYAVLDSVLSNSSVDRYLPQLLERIQEGIQESQISASLCIEICNHITNKDKAAFKLIMPTLILASAFLPPKDSKPLLDMLVLLENAVSRVPKNDLSKFVNDLMIYGNKYEHPYGLRIKTKISKVQRKLFTLKENNDTNKEQENSQQAKNHDGSEQANGCKTRSPILAQSNFLQRLAKAEEKKKKKCPSMASIFGDSGGGNLGGETKSQEAPAGIAAQTKEKEEGSDKEEIVQVKDKQQAPVVNGRCSPVLPEVVTILTPNKAKRSQTKSPEPIPIKNEVIKKPASVKMPPPPTYFEDDAQDFVIVPPKQKSTPLTEHQKEVLLKRRSDIPALYQDLSQDTLTDSQSLKEMIILKRNDKDCKSKANVKEQDLSVSEIVDLTDDSDVPESTDLLKKDSAEKGSKEQKSNSEEIQESSVSKSSVGESKDNIETEKARSPENNSGISEDKNIDGSTQEKVRMDEAVVPEVSKRIAESEAINDIKEKTTNDDTISSQENCNNNKCESSENLESPQEIIENTPQLEPVVSLNLTPTKQSGPPTPRSLIRRITLLEQEDSPDNKKPKFIEDREEEREKENIIINAKENLEKTLPSLVKRRSMRKSSCKFSTKKIDDVKEGKIKTKKELADPLKLVTDEDQKEKKATADIGEGPKTVLDEINKKTEVNNVSQLSKSVNQSEEPSEILLNGNDNDKIQEIRKSENVLQNSEHTEDANKCTQIDVLNEIKLHDNQLPIQIKNSTEENVSIKISGEGESTKEIKEDSVGKEFSLAVEESSDKETTVIEINEDEEDHSSSTDDNCSSLLVLNEEVDEGTLGHSDTESSPSGDVSNWAMATPEKRGRKKKNIEKNLSPRFSPKQLRSKRLSLTKSHEPADESKKGMRKSSPLINERKIDDKNSTEKGVSDNSPDLKPSIGESTSDGASVVENSSNDSVVSESNLQKRGRKRKSQDESAQEVEEKKKKVDISSSDEISQESLLVVKNNIVKPRKKKIIKSNVKHSPNNLEQWLIKSGKTVVKTSLISQEKALNESESKMIDEGSDIQINVGESKTLVVELPSTSSSPQNPDIVLIKASPELDDSGDIHNCTLVDDSSFNLNISSSEDEGVTKSKENSNDLPLEDLQCNETELPPSTSQESDESIGRRAFRRKRRLLKREETPFRESAPSPEEEQFDAKRERLTTPFRPRRRSAQMVKMATGEEEQQEQNTTPVRRRSISAVRLTENWPEGRLEEWVPCIPTPPAHSPSLGILRRKPVLSPLSSPTSSPSVKKKRVSFLDPPVSKGLLYYKGPETLGQIQHADIPPGEKPLWRDEETDLEKPGPSREPKKEPISSSLEAAEGEDELTAIQEFLNSTPDAPWSKTIPPELDVKQIPGLASSLEPLNDLLQRLTTNEEERSILLEEMKKLNVSKVSDISTITIIDLNRLCNQFPKVKSLVKIIEEYLEEKTSLIEPSACVAINNDPEETVKPMDVEDKTDTKEIKENELKPATGKQADLNQMKREQEDMEVLEDELEPLKSGEKELSATEVNGNELNPMEEEGELKIEEVKSVEFTCKSVQTEPVSLDNGQPDSLPTENCNHKVDINEMLKDSQFRRGLAEHIPRLLSEREFLERLDERFDELLQERSPFVERLAAHADYAFIARLCAAIVVLRENPG